MPYTQDLGGALRDVLAEIDEAFMRTACDPKTDDRALECLSNGRRLLADIIDKLDEETRMVRVG